MQLAELQKSCISMVPALEQISAHSIIRKRKYEHKSVNPKLEKENFERKSINPISYQYTVPNRASKNLR